MKLYRKHYLLILLLIFLPFTTVISQNYTSKNNYTGAWETATSWTPTWTKPQTNISNNDITINGFITLNSSLSFTGNSKLIINDTLVIIGDLKLDDKNSLNIGSNGILIIRGN